jgi:diguanylate cyclase (GGDEF)-like protein
MPPVQLDSSRRWRLLLLLLLIFSLPAMAAEALRGAPLLRRYTPEDYNATPQHMAIAADRDGRLFVGNNEGVLRYDGEQWQLIKLPGNMAAREVVAGRDGRIYVGSYDTFGWLRHTPDGDIVYEELLTAVGRQGKDRSVGVVWQVLPTQAGVYFRAEHSLDFLSYDRRQHKRWPMADTVRVFHIDGDTLYSRINGKGLCRFVDGRFELEPGGEMFANQPLPGMVVRPGWRLLVGDQGFYRADASGIRPLPNDAGKEFRDSGAYEVQLLADGSFAIGTRSGEVFRYGPDFRLRERINLGSFAVSALGSDHEGGLWAATEGDLVRMSMPSPWSFLGPEQGLRGNVYDYEWYDNALWIAGSRGFARMRTDADGSTRTESFDWIDFEGYALIASDSGLLMGYRNGLMVLDPGASEPRQLYRAEAEGVYELARSKIDPDIVYGISEQQLFVVRRREGRWQLDFTLSLDGASATTLIETAPGELWFGDSRGGPQRWQVDLKGKKRLQRDVFGERDGLEIDAASGTFPFLLDDRIHVVSGDKGFRYEGARFVPDTGPPFTLVDRPHELVVEQTPVGDYAFSTRQLWFRAKGQKEWKPLFLGSQLAAGYGRLRYNADGVLRVATWSGLLQFNPAEKQPALAPLKLGFERIVAELPGGGRSLHLPVANGSKAVEVPSGSRLHFRYGLVSMESGLEFRYFIHGVTDEWSEWTDRDLFLRAMTPGEYLLEVQARTKSGRYATPTSYRYRVLPQWYELWWVRGLGVLALLGVFALIVRELIQRRTQRYLEANRNLEARIAERTHELEEVNRKLAELATEDALTGVSNRRALEQGLQREWFRALDQRRPLSVLMIDVDNFKRYNDQHGHLEGDALLRNIAQLLRAQHDGKRELLARYGGEEFALLLPGMRAEEAQRRAEAIRLQLQNEVPGNTVSIGVAGFVPSVQGEPSQLLRRADAALYRAKRAGRNRVEVDDETALG